MWREGLEIAAGPCGCVPGCRAESIADLPDSRTTVLSFLEDTYERTLIVDGESATIILLDMWENKVHGARRWQWVPRRPAFQWAVWGRGRGGPVLFRVLGEVGPFASLDASFPPQSRSLF